MKNYKFFRVLFTLCLFGLSVISKAAPDPNFHIYICWGQSNMEGNATVPDAEKTGVSDRFQMMYSANDCSQCSRRKGVWTTATPPLARCFHWNNSGFGPIDYFGRTLVEKLDPSIRVGVIVVACGGADIQLFEKDAYEQYLNASTTADWLKNYAASYGSNPYGRIIELAKKAQEEGVIKGILVHQGETNTGQSNWPTRLKAIYEDMLSDLDLKAADVPLLVGEVRHTGPCSSHNNVIANVPNVIPTAHVISAEGCEAASDDYHFSVSGYKTLGKRYAETMLELLEQNGSLNNDITLSTIVLKEDEMGKVDLTVNIVNTDIQKVEIYADNQVIASNQNSYTWDNVPQGTHTVWAVGYDKNNKSYKSAETTISIFEEQKPYNGTPAIIPGKIEAEEFDYGGEGNAYHDLDEQNRNGGTLRNEGVDMSNTAIGYTQTGEWLEYTVEVQEEGDYYVESRVASGNATSQFTLYMDNQFIIPGADGTPGGFVDIPNTGDWETYTTVSTKLNQLSKGTHVLKLEITGDYVDIDYLLFKRVGESSEEEENPTEEEKSSEEEVLTGVTTGQYVDITVLNRTVSVYAPKGAHTNRPLLISCHGMNQDIAYQREQTKWEEVADTADFIVAYPAANGSTWDISGTTDTDFLIAIIDALATSHKIDRTRVYMSGFSMGGMLTYHCMNQIPDYFAAFAPISGYKFGDSPKSSTRAVPIIHTHGTGDDVVYYEANSNQEGAPAVIEKWKNHNNCTTKTTKTVDCATQTIYSGGDCEADIVLATVPNRGHIPANDCYHTSREIWRFVRQYTTGCGKAKPSIAITVEVTNEAEPGEVEISVNILNTDIQSVALFIDDLQVSENTSYTAKELAAGTHTIWAIGYDNSNKEYNSSKTTVTIFEPQTPYNGTPAQLPGKVEAEEFDYGGESNAYHDMDEQNRNGSTRNEGVDMNATAVGYVQTGEWIEYTVEVTTSGEYEVEASVASEGTSGSFTLYLDDECIIDNGESISVPNTGAYDQFEIVSATLSNLTKGTHILKMEITGDWFDIDYLQFNLLKASDETGLDLCQATTKIIPDGIYQAFDAMGRLVQTEKVKNGQPTTLKQGYYILENEIGQAFPIIVRK